MIAIEYVIPNKKHPFHHLHEVPSSVEVSKLLDKIDREDVSSKCLLIFHLLILFTFVLS